MGAISYIRKGLVGLALGSVLALGAGISPLEQAVADTPVAKQVRVKADTLWKAGKKKEAIKQYMKLKRVEDILGDSVKYVKYNAETGKTNFDRLVYQRNEKVKKPVLVLFYGPRERDPANFDAVQRQAIVFKDLVRNYKDKIRFVAYNSGNEKIKSWTAKIRARLADFKKTGIVAGPTIGMYNIFDLAKGETPYKNDGKIKQIDLMRSGPKRDAQINQWARDFPTWWINPNLFYRATPDNDGKLYRFMGTGDYKVVPKVNFRPD